MALVEHDITGSLLDALGAPAKHGTVTLVPYGSHDARVDGADVLLGFIVLNVADVGAVTTLTAGPWKVTIATRTQVSVTNGQRPSFATISTSLDLTGDTTWGEIVAGAVSVGEVTPTVLQQAADYAATATQSAADAEAARDAAQAVGNTNDTIMAGVAADSGSAFRAAEDAATVPPLNAARYATGSVIDFAALVADMETKGRPCVIPRGTWKASAANVLLNSSDFDFTYHFGGDGGLSVLTLPDGMADGDFLFRANQNADGTPATESFVRHNNVVFENLAVKGGASPNGGLLDAYKRSFRATGVSLEGLKRGFRTNGYTDLVRIASVHARSMTAGGWVYEQQTHGDGLTVDSLMCYGSAGLNLTKCRGGLIAGLISGWHRFNQCSVQLDGIHLEGDAGSPDPILDVLGSEIVVNSGQLYTSPARHAIRVDDSTGTRSKTRLTLGPGLTFVQRLDDPGSAVGTVSGSALHIANLAQGGYVRNLGARGAVYHQNVSASRTIFEYAAQPVTSDDAGITTALASRGIVNGDGMLRYQNAAWEVVNGDGSPQVATVASTGPVFMATAAVAEAAVGTNLAAGTYYYRAWIEDPAGRLTQATAPSEHSVTTSAGSPDVKLTMNAYTAPSVLHIVRGTASGTFTKHVAIPIGRATIELFDQGDTIGGYTWSASVPSLPTANSTRTALAVGGRTVAWDAGIPAEGIGKAWKRGDVIFNVNAAAGGKVGWVCVADGTPGTWKPFGAIDA